MLLPRTPHGAAHHRELGRETRLGQTQSASVERRLQREEKLAKTRQTRRGNHTNMSAESLYPLNRQYQRFGVDSSPGRVPWLSQDSRSSYRRILGFKLDRAAADRSSAGIFP